MTLAVARALRELALIGCIALLAIGATIWRIDEGVYAHDWLLSGAGYLTAILSGLALADYVGEAIVWFFGRAKQWRFS